MDSPIHKTINKNQESSEEENEKENENEQINKIQEESEGEIKICVMMILDSEMEVNALPSNSSTWNVDKSSTLKRRLKPKHKKRRHPKKTKSPF